MEQWSYFSYVVKAPSIGRLDEVLNALGTEGWELATSMSTVKSWANLSGNDVVMTFKKPGAGHAPSAELVELTKGFDAGMAS